MRQRLLILSILCAVLLLLQITVAQEETSTFDERILQATVFVMQARDLGTDLVITCVGSGTIVSRDGLILTNAHSTLPSADCPGDTILIALSVQRDQAPIPRYRAEVAQANPGIDLALLRITRELNGRLVPPGTLALPFVELANSSDVSLDDTITIVGYPGLGDQPVTNIRGVVRGFTAEPSGGEKSWIKSSAEIPGTMSGGGAYNSAGQLIGVPTTAPITAETPNTVCRAIQDTNDDGLVNTNDSCIPTGGFINALRPSNFARPLLRAARLGLQINTPGTSEFLQAGGVPVFEGFFFAPAVTDGMPTTVIGSLPAGSTSLYLFFNYFNMTPETVYELRVTRDGIPDPTFSLAPVRWSGGANGLWYVGTNQQIWPNGVYEFTLFVNGITAGTSQITIGGVPLLEPTFSNIVFGLADTGADDETVYGNGFVLPTGNTISARFIHRNMRAGVQWLARWLYNGAEVTRTADIWNTGIDGDNGAKVISITSSNGLFPGIYRLELYIEGRLAALSDFTVAGAREAASPRIFTNAHFTLADTPEEAPQERPISSFNTGIERAYALFDWEQIATGTLWTMRWTVDGEIFYERTIPWNSASNGTNFTVELTGINGVPDGVYRMELLINGIPLTSAQATVGIGQLPIDRFARAGGVQLRGQVIDADTREGIAGVSFIVISEDYSVDDFEALWDSDQIFARAITDRNGRFVIERPLEIGNPAIYYSIYITARGYLPVKADGFAVTDEMPNPLEVVVPLTRD